MSKNLFPTKLPISTRFTSGLAVAVALLVWAGLAAAQPAANGPGSGLISHKPRIIVTTDLGADPDDEQSLVRLLVSANEFDIPRAVLHSGHRSVWLAAAEEWPLPTH